MTDTIFYQKWAGICRCIWFLISNFCFAHFPHWRYQSQNLWAIMILPKQIDICIDFESLHCLIWHPQKQPVLRILIVWHQLFILTWLFTKRSNILISLKQMSEHLKCSSKTINFNKIYENGCQVWCEVTIVNNPWPGQRQINNAINPHFPVIAS